MLPARGMGPAKDELLGLLRRNGIADVEVEILDLEKAFRPSLFAISARAPEVIVYKRHKDKIIEVLEKTLRGGVAHFVFVSSWTEQGKSISNDCCYCRTSDYLRLA